MATVVLSNSPATPAYCSKAKKWFPKTMKSQGNLRRSCYQINCTLELPVRRSANYQPSLWSDDFVQSLSGSSNKEEQNDERIEILKKEVLQLIHGNKDLRSQLQLIDELQQLGVAYHFKEEIHETLWAISRRSENISMVLKDDLCATGLLFRLLRQHGLDVSQDIFINFTDEKGNFMPTHGQGVKGILSLYEASYLAKDEESIMDEARLFTTKELKNLLDKSVRLDPNTRELVAHALELPLDWRVTRLHNRWFIEEYHKKELVNPILLALANLDFNSIQMMFKKELKDASRWWTKLGLAEKLPFSRDRLVENYFMSVGFASEPQYQDFREASMKANCFVTTIDDIYDVHGTLNELELFTSVINSWDVNEANQLPEYMKICFMALFNTVNEMVEKIMKQKGLDITPHLKRAWADICNSYLLEAKWFHQCYKPNLEEYLGNAWITISGPLILNHAFCVSEHVTQGALQSSGYPSIAQWASTIGRLCDDLATSEDELQRGDVLKSIQCYMHKKDVSEAIAREHIKEIIRDNWKHINGNRNYCSSHEQFYKDVAINFGRMAHCIYQYGDGYAKPGHETKERIISVLIKPIML